MEDNKGRNHGCSNNWCSQDGTTQKHYTHSRKIKSRARLNYHKSKRGLNFMNTPLNLLHPAPPTSTSNNKNGSKNLKDGFMISGIVIGSLIVLAIIIYCLIRFIKRKNSKSQEEDEEALPNPRELTLNFVKHNHPIPELCTTPDTQPILDYYSSKAGLTNVSPPPVTNSNNKNNTDHKSTPVEINNSNEESPEGNVNHEYVPQYYNGIEIPPLGARIIPLERQVQIAKESTTANLNPANNKRKSNRSNRSISSILSISSRRKSSASNATISNYHNNSNNNNSSTTLTLIRETPRSENAANIVP